MGIVNCFLHGSGLGTLWRRPHGFPGPPRGEMALVWTKLGGWGAPVLCVVLSCMRSCREPGTLPKGWLVSKQDSPQPGFRATAAGPADLAHHPCPAPPPRFLHLPWTQKPSRLCSDPPLRQAGNSFHYRLAESTHPSESTTISLLPSLVLKYPSATPSFPGWHH